MAAPRLAATRVSWRPIAGARGRARSTGVRRQAWGLGLREYVHTYADTLSADFSARRHIEIPLRALRAQEHEILTTSRSLCPQDPLDALHALTDCTLDTLDALPVSVQTQQIRRTVSRCAARAFVRHPRGTPFARGLVERGEGLDGDTLGILIRRFRYAQVNDEPWALPGEMSTHTTAFHTFLGRQLTRLRSLSPDIFTQIMDIHIDNGMSVSCLTGLINQCMALRAQWSGRWTPAAWQVIIQAYRRDGDMQGCIRTYDAFRQAQGRTDEGWERYVKGTKAWPYEALLAACMDPSRVAKGRYTAPANMPEVIWRDMQHDGIPPPPRLVAHLLNLARENADAEAGHRLWRASTHVDIGCYTAYLHLIRRDGPTTPLRPLIRQILESRITANQTAPRVAALWRHALLTALAPGRSDFALARFLLDRCTHDETTLDAVAARLFAYGKSRRRGAAWWRSVWNVEPPLLRHAPMGIQSRNARTRRLTRAEWDLIARRIRELGGGGDAVLPLSRPLARWERSPNPYAPQRSSGGVDLEPIKRALVVLLEQCIGTRPRVGFVWEGLTPEGRVRKAREGVYRDLFGS